jgi:hypothetical protein
MENINLMGLTLQNIRIIEVSSYSGFDIHFTIQGKLYNFMVAKTTPPMPLNILHRFKETGKCPLCNRTISPFPIGNQPCMELKKNDRLLLDKLKKYLPA